jgi:putative flippase GtrA
MFSERSIIMPDSKTEFQKSNILRDLTLQLKPKMEKALEKAGCFIRRFIDFFYPPFRKTMTIQFFRYGVSGVANLLFDWVLYFFIYNYVMRHRLLDLGLVVLSPHIASLAFKIPIIVLSGFMLQKYVTFFESDLAWRVQFRRYSIVFVINLFINYLGLKILVDGMGFWATPSNIATSTVTVFVSYFSQKLYTFKENGHTIQE